MITAEATMPPDVARLFGAVPSQRCRAVRMASWGAATAQGRNRSHNEDRWGHRTDRSIVVADGMGGRPGGAGASSAAVTAALDALDRSPANPDWPAVIAAANDGVRAAALLDGHERTGAAFAGLHLGGGRATVFHLGDVRVHRLRLDEVEQLTVDHSVREQLARALIDPRRFALRSAELDALTGFLGDAASATGFGIRTLAVTAGDRLVISSDGVYRHLVGEAWARAASTSDRDAAELLVASAQAAGSTDDATAVVVTLDVIDMVDAADADGGVR